MVSLPNFAELAAQAQQFMAAIQAQIAELRGLRADIAALRAEQAAMRTTLERIGKWTENTKKAA